MPNETPETADKGTDSAEPAVGKAAASIQWIGQGLNDWITLLGNPDANLFRPNPNFEWNRLLRLVVIVLSFMGSVTGIVLVAYHGNLADVVFQKAPAAVLLGGALLAVGYNVVASICGIQIQLRDSFFTILLLGLPWLSLSAALYVWAGATRSPFMGMVLFVWIWLTLIALTRNLCRAISMIAPTSNRWLVRFSVVLPILLLVGGFIVVSLFAEKPEIGSIRPRPTVVASLKLMTS